MAIIQGNAKQGSTRGFYPKLINGSLRFNDDDSAYLSWTPASAGNRKTWTFSAWVKRANLGTNTTLFAAGSGSTNQTKIRFVDSNSSIFFDNEVSGSTTVRYYTSNLFRDPSSWYHFVFAVDTTQASDNDKVKIYVNGEQVTSFLSTPNYPSLNEDLFVNNANVHYIGRELGTGYLDAYLADVHFIDGQALTADDFGELKNGVWVAKDYAGTYGTNGFYLTFEDDTEVEAFNTVLYRGTGGTQSITGTGFTPDFVWIKARSDSYHHMLADTVRGAGTRLSASQTAAESSDANAIDSFDSDGFTLDSGSSINNSGDTYVAWCWKAGDSNVSNTDGTITSTVRANDTYGFSIVSYTGDGTAGATIGHGLSSAPDFIVQKIRDAADSWNVYHSSLGGTQYLWLNATDSVKTAIGRWNDTDPDSSVITLGNNGGVNGSGYDYIAYCWSETTGYSKFGSYDGVTGTKTITTDFKPAMVLIKNYTDTGGKEWVMFDNTRDVTNPVTSYLVPNSSAAEADSGSSNSITFNSDGFTLNGDGGLTNKSGESYIYAAFADTREAAFWLDQSGNDNDWQPVNLDHNDTVADSPTNNFCTFNPLKKHANTVFSDGNLKVSSTDAGSAYCQFTTIAMPSGQYYAEFTINTASGGYPQIGIGDLVISENTNRGLGDANGAAYQANGTVRVNGTAIGTSFPTFTVGDVIRVAYDADNNRVYFAKNDTWINSGNPTAGTGYFSPAAPVDGYVFASSTYQPGSFTANFGQQPFKYDPPA